MFRDVLAEVVAGVDGALGAVLMDADGLPIEQVSSETAHDQVETLGMELSVVLREVRKATKQIEAGSVDEVMIRGAKVTTLIRVLTDEYFVALALPPGACAGKGRFLLRRAAPRLREQL